MPEVNNLLHKLVAVSFVVSNKQNFCCKDCLSSDSSNAIFNKNSKKSPFSLGSRPTIAFYNTHHRKLR